jgi:PilZ domain
MVETRIAPRLRVLKAATIDFGGGAIDCTIHDLSITGAALKVPIQTGIPGKFTLVVPGDGLHLPCHVVWHRGYRIGVAFDD